MQLFTKQNGIKFAIQKKTINEIYKFIKQQSKQYIVYDKNQLLQILNQADINLALSECKTFKIKTQQALQILADNIGKEQLIQSFNSQKSIKNHQNNSLALKFTKELRNFIIQEFLCQEDINNIIEQLGGCKQYNNIETPQLNEPIPFKWPQYNINKRKPKLYRLQKDNKTLSDAEIEKIQFLNCIDILDKINIISKQMYKQIIDACQYDEVLCFQTAISACMQYKKGKCSNNLKELDKPQNFIRKKIDDEITMIKTLGYNVEKIDEKYDQSKLDIPCYQGKFSILKISVPIESLNGIQLDILFYLQNPDNYVELLQNNKQNFEDISQPLIIDQGTFKFNLQLQGCYPYCMPIVNIQSDLLSQTGKSIIIQHIYQILQRNEYNYNSMRIFNSIIDINNGLEQKLEDAEVKLHLSFNKSTINIKQIKQYKQQLQNSYIQRANIKIQQQNLRKMQFLIVNSFLTILNEEDKDKILSTLKIWYHGEQHNIMVKQAKITVEDIEQVKDNKIQQIQHNTQKEQHQKEDQQHKLQNQPSQINNDDIINKIDLKLKNQFLEQRQKLPVIQNRKEIYNMISINDITIITAETGTGKSTNIPQIIFEENKNVKILVTQPRRIAAISLAKRVQQESGLPWNQGVGYQVLNDNQTSKNTIISYITIGIILRKIYQNLNSLQQYTHIIIDEVHEKSVDIIVILSIIKILLKQNIKLPKIIIMSATMDTQQIQQYYSDFAKVDTLNIKGKQFDLDINYFDNKLDMNTDQLEVEIDNRIIQILNKIKQDTFQGNILIFLPGIREIQNLAEELTLQHYNVIQCHSKVNQQQINILFSNSLQNYVILATNIAEASVTIPNVKYVIDSGLERRVTFSLNRSKYTYTTVLISKQSATQRAGRAGRTSKGTVFRCFSLDQYEKMPPQKFSDIKTSDLSGVFINLQVLYETYKFEDLKPENFFQMSLEPLELTKIQQNIKWLLNQNFLFFDNQSEIKVSENGKIASQLPIQPNQSKLIILCQKCKLNIECLDLIISILNADQLQFKQGCEIDVTKVAGSDTLTYLNAYKSGLLTKKSVLQIKEQLTNIQQVIQNYVNQDNRTATEKEIEFLLQLINKKNLIYKNVVQTHFYQVDGNMICDPNKSSVMYRSQYQLISYNELLKTGQLTTSLGCNRAFIIGLMLQYEGQLQPNQSIYSINDCNISGNLRDICIVLKLCQLYNKFNIGYDLILKIVNDE